MFSFSLMGVAVRILTVDYSIFQISFTRNFFGFLPILMLLAYNKQMGALKTRFNRQECAGTNVKSDICKLNAFFSQS